MSDRRMLKVETTLFERIFHFILLLVIVVGMCELMSYALIKLTAGSRQAVLERRNTVIERQAEQIKAVIPGAIDPMVIHPYLGFIHDADRVQGNPHGLVGDDILAFRNAKDFNVLILGGSVAFYFYTDAAGELKRELSALPWLKDREVNVFCAALSGYKQPQQLMAFNYLLGLGAKIDMVINLDGFNEVAVSPADNKGINLFYPRSWPELTSNFSDKSQRLLLGKFAVVEELQAWLAQVFARLDFLRSNTLLLTWDLSNKALERMRSASIDQLMAKREAESFAKRGYVFKVSPENEAQALAANWARDSKLISDLAATRGIIYVHVLQPNQYVEGSKPLSDEEKRSAYRPDQPMAAWAAQGYAELKRRGAELASAGVKFFDASKVFVNHPETLYKDVCCHYNQAGSQILAQSISDFLAKQNIQAADLQSFEHYQANAVDTSILPPRPSRK